MLSNKTSKTFLNRKQRRYESEVLISHMREMGERMVEETYGNVRKDWVSQNLAEKEARIVDYVQEQFEKNCVYKTWIYLWASVYSSLDESERRFRQSQLLRVLRKLKNVEASSRPDSELLSIIIGTVLNCASVDVARTLYEIYKALFEISP